MDFICDLSITDSLHNGLPLNISVYDGATWSAVTPLSLWSVTHGSQPIDFPDFTEELGSIMNRSTFRFAAAARQELILRPRKNNCRRI